MDKYYRPVELPIGIDLFRRLPRNAAYKYEYSDGRAVLTPRPKSFTCALDLAAANIPADTEYPTRPLPLTDAAGLEPLFAAAVRQTQPFASLEIEAAAAAARECYRTTLTGGDGPVIEAACFQSAGRRDERTVGGVLVTLVPDAVLTDPFAGLWKEPPPADAVPRRLGCPHLTWVFVDPWEARQGVGTALLSAAAGALRGLGFGHLASTFLLDNGPSALWHWRNGFRLLPQYSAMRKKWEAKASSGGAPPAASVAGEQFDDGDGEPRQ